LAYYADPSTDSRQVLRNTAETLTVTFYSGESGTDADGAVTIGIVDEAGATVVASGTSTTSSGSGVYTYDLAAQSNLKNLTATWSGTWGSAMTFGTHHEVVGGWYATPAEVDVEAFQNLGCGLECGLRVGGHVECPSPT
jgi:hypothetical protein